MQTEPARKHIVLVGGGHSHVTVIRSFGMKPEPGAVLTVVAKELEAPYSGMLPGYVAGHYSYDDCHIDLVRLASWAGARLVHGTVTGVDRQARRITINGRPPLAYDLLSIDVGITPALDAIEGAEEHGLAVKPVSTFAEKWQGLEAAAGRPDGPRRIAVVGSGAAGFELILAIRHRLLRLGEQRSGQAVDHHFFLIGGALLPSHNARARQLARAELAAQSIELIEGVRARRIEAGGILLDDGRRIAADAVLLATSARPAAWFEASGLPTDGAGFIAVRPTLQLLDDDDVFAVGDCASVLEHPREKAGVFAVRQGPPLTDNLRRRVRGEAAQPFQPQSNFLTLLSTGGTRAIAARNGLAVSGSWVWRWKDRIDREFMDKFNKLPAMAGQRTGGGGGASAAEWDDTMRCAGCAAKVGPVTLRSALDRLPGPRAPVRDDCAVIPDAGATRVETIDFFRAFWPEPYLFGEIAANHAMSDVFAMGARPTHALANVVLPYARPHLVAEDLFQLLAGAEATLSREGVALLGGHSSEGAELAAGFFVSGVADAGRLLPKGPPRPGDRLILTRPLGTGILFAALMRGKARGTAIREALEEMRRSNGPAMRAALGYRISAATDVTGFGLAGHLVEMLEARGAKDDGTPGAARAAISARLALDRLPLYGTVLDLARQGIASTLLPENARLADALTGAGAADAATGAILFDPQTSGGLLLAVSGEEADACLAALQEAGASRAAVIGEIVAGGTGAGGGVLLEGALR